MRKIASTIGTGFLLLGVLTSSTVEADSGKICYPTPPGIEGSRLDVPNEIVLQKVTLGPKGQTGFIATEYLGSPNLQASVYWKTHEGYCLVGEFDGVTSMEFDRKTWVGTLFNVTTESRSGSDRFFRRYRFIGNRYRLAECYVKNENNMRRRCTESEK